VTAWLRRLIRPFRGVVGSRPVGRLTGWIFAHMSFLIPFERLHETETLVAFHHPNPAYRVHVLIVPKRAYASLLELPPDDSQLLREVIETVQLLVKQLGLEKGGYRLIVNGGPFQSVKQLHFHLIQE
jgi:histidine triad (HIT) family protein